MATRDEILESINSGLPILRAMAEKEGKDAVELMDFVTERGRTQTGASNMTTHMHKIAGDILRLPHSHFESTSGNAKGLDAAMLAQPARHDPEAGSTIASYELREQTQRVFPDAPQSPDDDRGFIFCLCGDGTKITIRREPLITPDLPPAKIAA